MINVKCKTQDSRHRLLSFDFRFLHFIFFLLVLIFSSSCQKQKILFTEQAEIGGDGWAYSDSIRFAFAAQDTSTIYDLNLEISHTEDYAWQNAYVMVKTGFPDDSIKTDILSLELLDGTGAWAGVCKAGKCRLTIPLQLNLRFPVSGDYSLTFIQHMREEVVPGILGLKLTVVVAERQKGRRAEE